ncbi:hypothetical protein [Streptomyces sp. NPDC058045]|uniref:hypothetical protein n=1 Tax=Streptomyces sp. NPDC058045 TaxID=3346311 RepID=UPI0036F084AA
MSLPGADELFRTTGGTALTASTPRRQANGEPRVPAPAGESDAAAAREGAALTDAERTATAAEAPQHAAAQPGTEGSRSREGETGAEQDAGAKAAGGKAPGAKDAAAGAGSARRRGRAGGRRPSGRERHDEKITVYVSAEELMDLEHARLVLRGEHGLAVDRGRIVREAVAVVLADLESRGEASILVRRLRGR